MGSDQSCLIRLSISLLFQLTLPEWGATRFGWDYNPCQLVSTHAPRVGSDQIRITANVYSHVSTHAPRAGSYSHRDVHPSNAPRFNSRSPSGERRSGGYLTISGWGFNSRSPCGERRWLFIIFIYFIIVSTHAPRAGSDSGSSMMPGSSVVSTHAPRVGSDVEDLKDAPIGTVSTHAPRAGSDPRGIWSLRRGAASTHAPRAGSDSHDRVVVG